MLKITVKERPGSLTFVLEGRLCGAWAAEADRAWSRLLETVHDREILLDLAGVTFVDRDGEALLAAILGRGTKVRASGVLVSHVVEEVQQRVLGSERGLFPRNAGAHRAPARRSTLPSPKCKGPRSGT
jgi:anti-anti-sigma regulatory factor